MPIPSRLALSRLSHTPRRLHQAVLRHPPGILNDDQLHILYKDLMLLEVADPPPRVESPADSLLVRYAKQGNIRDFEQSVSRMSAPPTEYQRDLHVKAHIVNASLSSALSTQPFPTSALAVLHQYEANGHVAPIKSYTRVISALFNVQTCPSSDPRLGRAAAQAQAWDLFAHMRYVAHPVPDAHLYALMIRACGSFSRPEPERALDLWKEMQENAIVPTKGAYEAVITVCGRAGPEWLGEGMRLAREMSERYPITGANARGLWCALLEGCKRAGDLKKARWILAKAIWDSDGDAEGKGLMVDADFMTHIFHAYASYKPPFRRETTRLVGRDAGSNVELSANDTLANDTSDGSDIFAAQPSGVDDVPSGIPLGKGIPSFSRLPPQTPSDVVMEARTLFNRILDDKNLSSQSPHRGDLLTGKFACVQLTSTLLNAYLSVYNRHASIETSREAFSSLFDDSPGAQALRPDEYTYVNALERCATAREEDRQIASQWAQDLWQHWELKEVDGVRDGRASVGSFARLIERAHTAMRRVLALSGDVDGALTLLRSFVSRYPPNAIMRPAYSQTASFPTSPTTSSTLTPIKSPSRSPTIQLYAKPPILSTRTVLTNPTALSSLTARPLVRLSSAATLTDDRVPPVIGFGDVELLHARLVQHGRIKDLGYIKWVCMAYAGALKKRRDAVLRATPTRSEDE